MPLPLNAEWYSPENTGNSVERSVQAFVFRRIPFGIQRKRHDL